MLRNRTEMLDAGLCRNTDAGRISLDADDQLCYSNVLLFSKYIFKKLRPINTVIHTCIGPKPNWAYLDLNFCEEDFRKYRHCNYFPAHRFESLCSDLQDWVLPEVPTAGQRCYCTYITETESSGIRSEPLGVRHWLKFFPLRSLVEMKIAPCMRPPPSSPICSIDVATIGTCLARWISEWHYSQIFYKELHSGDCGCRERHLPKNTYIPNLEYHSVCPLFGSGTLPCGWGVGGSQFRRLAKKLKSLATLC